MPGCWRKRKCGVNGSPDVGAAGVAVAAVDCGGWVPALLGGHPVGLGEHVGQVEQVVALLPGPKDAKETGS